MISAMFAAAMLLADASAAAAPQAAPAPAAEATQAAKPKADKNEMVCRYDANLGTRLPKKVCTRVGDAQQKSREDRDNLDRMQRMRPLSGS
jgi:hypothetical protein